MLLLLFGNSLYQFYLKQQMHSDLTNQYLMTLNVNFTENVAVNVCCFQNPVLKRDYALLLLLVYTKLTNLDTCSVASLFVCRLIGLRCVILTCGS